MRSPQSLPFSWLNNLNSLSLSSQQKCSSPQIIFVALLWTVSNRSMCFLCWGLQSWKQGSWGVGVPLEQRGRIPSLNQLNIFLSVQPRIRLAFRAMNAHCWLVSSFSSSSMAKSFLAGLLSIPLSTSVYQYWMYQMFNMYILYMSIIYIYCMSSHFNGFQSCMFMAGCALIDGKCAKRLCSCPQVSLFHALTRLITNL